MREMIELGQQGSNNTKETEEGWQKVKTRTRKFVVGLDEDVAGVRAEPKLHFTRLQPHTKPEDPVNLLKPRFSEVKCEIHPSRFPDSYTYMKVTMSQDNFKRHENERHSLIEP
ncbi:unnamed protein product [Phaedon cochleariae]|uniref:Uncharacterized protein n=1 Tax=Phaedon cochleariae TaxID=80249 RepID=A0A9N9SFM5_PHACE|nr:unnamed protein product [Phaedon cochleariae]